MAKVTTDPQEAILRWMRSQNPFRTDRINTVSEHLVDVRTIHGEAFQRLVALAEESRDEHLGLGVVVWGEAGIGKSHLLARLGHWAEGRDLRLANPTTGSLHSPPAERALLVMLHNVQADASRLPNYLLNAVISTLTLGRRRNFRNTPLYLLVKSVIEEALRRAGPANLRSRDRVESAYDALIDDVMEQQARRTVKLDRSICQALLRFYISGNVAHYSGTDDGIADLAVRWLSGDRLEPEEARKVGIQQRGPSGKDPLILADDEQVQRVLYTLTFLASYRKQPLILCFDQVDNLPTERIRTLSHYLHALLDTCGNLVVVLSGVQQTLNQYRKDGVFSASAWDRLAHDLIPLKRIRKDEARTILATRLEAGAAQLSDLEMLRHLRSRDPLFPLGSDWFERRTGTLLEFRPRDVINWARERWSEQQRLAGAQGQRWLDNWTDSPADAQGSRSLSLDSAVDRLVDERLATHQARLQARPHLLPPNGDNLSGLVRTLLRGYLEAHHVASTQISGTEMQTSAGTDGGTGGTSLLLLSVEEATSPGSTQRPPCDLVLHYRLAGESQDRRVGLLFLSTHNATSTTAALRRLHQAREELDHLLLITEERRPLALGVRADAAGRRTLLSLRQLGSARFSEVELTFPEYAELDALQDVVGQARAGELEVEPVRETTDAASEDSPLRVSDREVLLSHLRKGRFWTHPLLRQLLQGPGSQDTHAPTSNGTQLELA